jgi:3-hydroxymyristoyl/3-hydroxydecanoyl-(acyl carrier protein) dehydratase
MSEIVAARVEIAADHPAFDGHFPGRPVLPGVALLAEVLEAGAREPRLVDCIGSAPRIAVAKFLAPVGPGALLVIAFRVGARSVDWRIDDGSRTVAAGQIARADIAAAA